MKFTIQFVSTIVAGISCSTILASPIKHNADIAVRAPVRMTAADRFLVSGLDYMDWANKMVSEGKAYWPDKPVTTESPQSSQAAPEIKGIVCTALGASESSYAEGEANFCNYLNKYVSASLTGLEYITRDLACDGQNCDMIVDIAFSATGVFISGQIPQYCSLLFDEIYDTCNGGGSGQITVGSETGFIEALFEDGTATCPATTDSFYCAATSA